MCGILGKITFSGHHESPESFTRALRLLEHRGPDDRGLQKAVSVSALPESWRSYFKHQLEKLQ